MASRTGNATSDRVGPTEANMHRAEPLNMVVCPVMCACQPAWVAWPSLYETAYRQARATIARRLWVRQWEPSVN